ncbi:HD domain-containing protein [Flavobacterium sp.]|uniref:HD domain-containing protein n=1 Tax=Flavobacterium sp. TaxID=239 RepID=UPI0025E729E0|nr:HD domain-containing protein [Flavobacterium sp.]
MDTILDTVRCFASKAHQGQMRKYTPDPYIVHPIRVSEMVMPFNSRLPVIAAALLHDVVEDTIVSETALSVFLHNIMDPEDAAETMRLVIQLTDIYVPGNYPNLNRRKRKERELERLTKISPEAQTIKYADIVDNTREIATCDPDFAPEYLHECLAILQKADQGNSILYSKALESVKSGLYAIKEMTSTVPSN